MKKNALLDAAESLLFEHGTQALTLAAVADRAGVSKGGLLYHFSTKEALVKAMVARVIEEFDDLIASFDDGSPGSYTRAYVEATFEILSGEARAYRRWSAITAAATDPELAEPLNEAMRCWHGRDPGEDPDPVTAGVVRLAAEGLWEVVSHAPALYGEEELGRLKRRMLALLER
ncbi:MULTISPECIES: TetR/AcrR family transcriptional regulator [Thermomonosporaceae]|uniref:TetR/AcrR family transcriptional regulator n=1 Tax=Thermomonosporaceae TaxID=2012 RepID=UPI00255AD197|nr:MULTISPECIES: TetR/AcrR family transcriptional regulator [Thermomonosporaceae]MDL4771766.1 TetR/AcrR family transcriptional regulator [Actinomadura xylanilytica]